MIELVLWRHAEAEDGSPDLNRALTRRGQVQAASMAEWLRPRLPDRVRIFVSEARRSQQTAAHLGKHAQVLPELNPDQPWERVLSAIGWPECGESLVVVGHQPWIGQVASQLLTGTPTMLTIKKGAAWWFARRQRQGDGQILLRTVMMPSLLDG
ncbi:phosphohistidine phosphatase SixA [Microvirgula sp. AG722]|uniref:SixA phosphatase family protein n=1 Tax=Microvirgula sp. AG722 TaxID=2183901 RepID=UPI000DC5C76C|nr:histidine phosphatase family protein [Microvirgula sp. AG722]RAS15546.1 phosphohistidine phosphatase SixA [Microvirgula sp. AG722]